MEFVQVILAILCITMAFIPVVGSNQAVADTDLDQASTTCIQHERQDAHSAYSDQGVLVTIQQTGNPSVIRFVFNGTDGDPMFDLSLPDGVEVVNSSGFKIDGGSAQREYNADSPSLEVSLGARMEGLNYSSTKQNVVVPLPNSDEVDLYFRPNSVGYVGSHFALLGEYTVGTAHAGCQRIRVILPDVVDLPNTADHYAEAIATVGEDLSIGHRYRLVTAFVAPQDTGRRNGFTPLRFDSDRPSSEFYISPDSRLNNPRNTWIHEYVHTRQATVSPRWMSEGAAMFFTTQMSVEHGWINPIVYDGFFSNRTADDGMPDPNLTSEQEPYFHGMFFYTQVSHDIRNSNQSLEDVYYQLNQRVFHQRGSDSISQKDFEVSVESTTNKDVTYNDPMHEPVKIRYFIAPDYLPKWLITSLPVLALPFTRGLLVLVGLTVLHEQLSAPTK